MDPRVCGDFVGISTMGRWVCSKGKPKYKYPYIYKYYPHNTLYSSPCEITPMVYPVTDRTRYRIPEDYRGSVQYTGLIQHLGLCEEGLKVYY